MSTHPYLTEWRESRLSEWRETDLAERVTLEAPELRHVSDPAPARCVVTTGRDNKPIHIGGAVSRKSASPYAGYGPHRREGRLSRAWKWLATYPDRAVMAMAAAGLIAAVADVAFTAPPPTDAEAAAVLAAAARKP